MADLLQTGLTALAGWAKKYAGQTFVYRRKPDQATLTGTPGQKLLKVSDGAGGFRLTWADADFKIVAADLVLAGKPAEPEVGDEILWTLGGVTYVFEVLPQDGEPHVRTDAYRVFHRVHTKLVGTE